MKRVRDNGKWTFFSPDEASELHDSYGADFEAKGKNGENALDIAERMALQPCSTHSEHVEWCSNTIKCSFHSGREEIVELLKDLLSN